MAGINIEKMKQKLDKVTGKGSSGGINFWKPNEGKQTIRFLPTPDGDPFVEYHFHYNVNGNHFLCPKQNYDEDCPVCDFASEVWRDAEAENDEAGKEMAKDLFAKQRYFSPVLVRGEEDKGPQVYGYGVTVYKELLNLVLDPDFGDITSADKGHDIKIGYTKGSGGTYAKTTLQARPKKTPIFEDGTDPSEMLEDVPDMHNDIHTPLEKKEIVKIMDDYYGSLNETEDGDVEKYASSDDSEDDAPSSVADAFAEIEND